MQSPESDARTSPVDKDIVVITGFSRPTPDAVKDIQHVRNFVEALTAKIKFASQRIILGCPQEHAQDHPSNRIDFIKHAIGEAVRDRIIVGLSYGGLLALGAECERVKSGGQLSPLVLVDSPLNPNVDVNPPSDGRFDGFSKQYEHRVATALRCMAVLHELPESELRRIITIGTTEDDIVPPDAKHLPIEHIGHHELPSDIKGHRLSPEKIQAVIKIMLGRII